MLFFRKQVKKPKRKPTREIGDRSHLAENSRRIHVRGRDFGLPSLLRRLADHDPTLTTLSLTGYTHLSPGDLAVAMNRNPYVQSLSLQACLLGNEGLIAFLTNMECVPNLAVLDLSGNGLSDEGIVAFCEHSSVALPKLKELNLSWNRISCRGAEALGAALTNNKNRWTHLDLSGVTLGRGGGHDAGLGVDETNQETIGDAGLISLSEGLKTNTSLQNLLLNRHDQDITHVGLEVLAQTLRHHPLQHLELNRTRVDDQAMLALGKVLHETSLLHLDVTINSITSRSIEPFAKTLLLHNPPLQTLLLTQNQMDLNALECLEKAARYNTNLLKLEVYGHAAGKEGSNVVWRIRPWLRKNRTHHALLQKDLLGVIPFFVEAMGKVSDKTRLYRFLCERPDLLQKVNLEN